jgi:hypothetical protein
MEVEMENLVPVSEWDFRLWKVVWENKHSGQTKTLWCVNTETHLHDDCQRRWPGSYYHEYMEYDMGEAPRPPQIGTLHGARIDEDGWTFGELLAQQRGFK